MPDRSPKSSNPPPLDAVALACTALQEILDHLEALARMGGGAVTEGLLQATIDDCPDAVIVSNHHAGIAMVNGAAARLFGTSTRGLKTLTLWDLMHASSQPDFDVLWREFLRARRQRGSLALRHHDGTEVEVAYCSSADVLPNRNVTVLRRRT